MHFTRSFNPSVPSSSTCDMDDSKPRHLLETAASTLIRYNSNVDRLFIHQDSGWSVPFFSLVSDDNSVTPRTLPQPSMYDGVTSDYSLPIMSRS
jgi:hypothetical protein